MNSAVAPVPVAGDEIKRRLEEYRRLGFEKRLPAVIVYPPEQHGCPWGDCDAVIAGIDFQLDRLGDTSQREKWLAAWWKGRGLVGRCPGCKRSVLFGYQSKRAVADPAVFADSLLTDEWEQTAVLAPKAPR
jgi:hypothetical protein